MPPDTDASGALLSGKERHFASGSNHAGEIRACALSGVNIGVCALHLNDEAVRELLRWLRAGARVFIDSGAFGEVAFTPNGPQVKREMGPMRWAQVLRLMGRLVAEGGERVHPVAPDQVGNQEVTLQRLKLWRPELRAMRADGARLIVPVQKGTASMEAFWLREAEVLGFDDFTVGVPSKKDATTLEELHDFLLALPPLAPPALHMLGLGPTAEHYPDVMAAVHAACPRATVWCDSVRITALVGRGGVRADGSRASPRPLTAARDALLAQGHLKAHHVAQVKTAALARVFHQEARTHRHLARMRGWRDEADGLPATPTRHPPATPLDVRNA